MNQLNAIAENFTKKYVEEYDYKYSNPELPLNKAFLPNITEVIEILSSAVAYGILKEMGADIYKNIKTKMSEYYLNRKEVNKPHILLKGGVFQGIKQTIISPYNSGITVMKGEKKDTTILMAGKLRPLFRITRGSFLILMNLTIEYEGSPQGLIEEDVAPSFLLINVDFRKSSH
jgi:hypothetical protein